MLSVPPIVRWAFLDSVWLARDPAVCRAAEGACWAVIGEKHRVMLFATYPFSSIGAVSSSSRSSSAWWQRRSCAACGRRLLVAWGLGIVAALMMQFGGVFGLTYVPTSLWGGSADALHLHWNDPRRHAPRRAARPRAPVEAAGHPPAGDRLHRDVRGVPLVNILFVAALMFHCSCRRGSTSTSCCAPKSG